MSVDFLDSNVFVYLFDDTDLKKRARAETLVSSALADSSGVISYQVVQETINVLTRKLGAPPDDITRFLDAVLAPLWRVAPSPALYRRALELHGRYGFSYYDSLIVAAALDAGSDRLMSEDLQSGQSIGSLVITNPFAD